MSQLCLILLAIVLRASGKGRSVRASKRIDGTKKYTEADRLYWRAANYISQKNFQAAERGLRDTLQLQPNHVSALTNLGVLQETKGDASSAYQSFATAARSIDKDGTHSWGISKDEAAKVFSNHARLQQQRGELSGARSSYSKAIAFNPKESKSYSLLADVLVSLRDYEQADKNYRAALELNPKSMRALVNRGNLLAAHLDKPVEAEQSYKAALLADPTAGDVRLNLGALQEAQQDVQAAEQSYLASAKLSKEDSRPYRALGLMYHKHHRLRAAERSYRAALRIDPDQKQGQHILTMLASVLYDKQQTKKARRTLAKAVELEVTKGNSPVTVIMSTEGLGGTSYLAATQFERRAFEAACYATEELGQPKAATLLAALDDLRSLENDRDWITSYFLESHRMFGTFSPGKAYGTVWFPSWQKVASSPPFQNALRSPTRLTVASRTSPIIMIAGSGLGEQCLFVAALGARCIGYELLCNSTVSKGRRVIEAHGLSDWIDLRCGDAAAAKDIVDFSAVWINDAAWEHDSRNQLLQVLVEALKEGAAVVAFSDPRLWASSILEDLPVKFSVNIQGSWHASHLVTVHRRSARTAKSVHASQRASEL
eukprot:TRINITY_DN10376_c0_g3_i1.p1 TRINITY_DN10376_c0_g3~~TRINITY_DN10376_c0_g3_i1.p1  ORF type:complete len:600 (+),score=89.13 TRINITY_DN10376_c0_g3_i1:100-1899(+)